ncbi:MAG: hypothetical protein JNM27_08525 [Leptospirales bacterium]|nr:hypothetical protein [Leptospirales bacterium]
MKRLLGFALLFLTLGAAFGEAGEENIVYREAVVNARKSGFADLEIDNLHGTIGRRLKHVLELGGLPDGPGDYEELTSRATTRAIITGKDSDGKQFLRLRLRDGFSYSSTQFPSQYVFRAHCYLYPGAEGTMDKIVFQFYRISYSGSQYVRDLRRYIHPEPKDVAQAEGKPIGAELQLLNNSNMKVEYYEALSTVPPKWEGPDGVPKGTLEWTPVSQITLNSPTEKNPIPYSKQVQIIFNYKKLLRQVERILARVEKTKRLDRDQALEKVIDYNGSSF